MNMFTPAGRRHWVSQRVVVMLACALGGCGGDIPHDRGGGETATQAINGRVFAGDGVRATVCLDENRNGRCESGEKQADSDASGNYALKIPSGSTAPLVAQVIDAAYRMASPSASYSTNITPFTTLVHLSAETEMPLAEDLARDVVGLPPRFRIAIDSPPAAGTLTGEVARSVVAALKAVEGSLDMSSASALRVVAAAFPPALKDLPVLRIDTAGGAPVESTETSIDAAYTLTNPAQSSAAATLLGTIRGRGHSTWGLPKNPYRIEFDKGDPGLGALADLLGMPKNRHWVLLADYYDRSLMRNKLAFTLGNSSVFSAGMKWNPSGQYVEAYLNGDYIGVYLLAEDIRIAAERLNLKTMGKNDVDGGYIVEVDLHYVCSARAQHVTPQGVVVCVDTPDDASITEAQASYVTDLLNKVEGDIYGSSTLGAINTTSFVDWYLLNEAFRSIDANFYSSVFMWKDSDGAATASDRLLNMGPIWDFDLSAGNVNYYDGWKPEGCWVNQARVTNWFARLLDNQTFLDLAISRWKQKRAALGRFVDYSIDTYARRLDAAQQRNFARWPILGSGLTNYYGFATYAEEVGFLKAFLRDRFAWLDKAYASADSYRALCK